MNYEQILQAAKDEVAKSYGYKNWDDLFDTRDKKGVETSLKYAALLAMQRITTGQYEVNFDGYVKALLKIEGGRLTVEAAMNGYGDAIDVSNITIVKKS